MSYLDQLFIEKETIETADGFTVVVRCNPSHPVYTVHVPGNPITPGACLLQAAEDLFRQKMDRPVYLKSAKNIKYLSILIPAEGKEVKFNYSHVVADEAECKAQVVITDDSTVFTKMSLAFSYERI